MAYDYGVRPANSVGVVSVVDTIFSVTKGVAKELNKVTIQAWVGSSAHYSPNATLRKILSGSHLGFYVRASIPLQPLPPVIVPDPTKTIFDKNPRFQFGQAGTPWWLQTSGCNDVSAQMIIEWYKDKLVPLIDIRRASGGPIGNYVGLMPNQVLAALNHYGVNFYQKAYGVDANFVREKSKIGPVLVVVEYGYYPNLKNGPCTQSRIALKNGRNDCGFGGTHALLCIGASTTSTNTYMRDPDHGSAARPFKPAYDIITAAQLTAAMKAVPGHQGWTNTYCLYPTKRKGA